MLNLFSEEGLARTFDHHNPPSPTTTLAYETVRAACKDLARTVGMECPECPERTLAYRAIQQAMFWANSGIAQNGVNPKGVPRDPPPS